MGKTCQICGENSGIYPLCKEHLDMKAKGLVIKNEKTGIWELVTENKTKETKNENTNCVVCGETTQKGFLQCKACYYETLEYKDQIDKNSKLSELNNYYYNLKGNIYRMSDFNKVKNNCNKLLAIALLTKDLHNTTTLKDKVEDDIKEIINKKQKQNKPVITETIKKQDSQQEKLIPTIDGHQVKSQGERIIDDFLFNNRIVHSYSPNVTEIDINSEQSIEADWFIPIISSNKGIYIEYWGMNTKEYLENKKRKKEQYVKNNIPFIQIEKEEPFEDIRILEARILRELKAKAKEYYKYDIIL